MFSKTKNIDTAFRHIRLFSICFLAGCAGITSWVVYRSEIAVQQAQQRIYLLSNGRALEAWAAERKDNIPVEARDHVKMFHHYFFSLDPDEKVIDANIRKALYLADASAKRQYQSLKENSYYANIIAGNISQSVIADSIYIDTEQYPYYFRYEGRQEIVRPMTLVTRRLVTEGYLRNLARSDHNPHGFLIEKWRTLDNTDINMRNR